jgi:hypothetical protein
MRQSNLLRVIQRTVRDRYTAYADQCGAAWLVSTTPDEGSVTCTWADGGVLKHVRVAGEATPGELVAVRVDATAWLTTPEAPSAVPDGPYDDETGHDPIHEYRYRTSTGVSVNSSVRDAVSACSDRAFRDVVPITAADVEEARRRATTQ